MITARQVAAAATRGTGITGLTVAAAATGAESGKRGAGAAGTTAVILGPITMASVTPALPIEVSFADQ